MALHRLTSVCIGVPNVAETATYYEEFGLTRLAGHWFATVDGGEQLRLVPSPRRRLVELGIGVDDPDDLHSMASRLGTLGVEVKQTPDAVTATDPGTGVRVVLGVAAPLDPHPGAASFLRCSADHHNLLVQAAPIPFLHHTSWQVDDVDEIGRGATALLNKDPARHVWGLGRHHIGSNFFWYLKDPAGNFSEYYADMDCIVDDQLWEPGVWTDMRALYSWGPPVPESFLAPDDLAELMVATHNP
jgi:catechol 2,3-dioxygenase-like lactoylglutathione lyase family enzyme